MNWDDLKYFLAVARTGAVSTAARALGVNHTTVSRRISTLEEVLGTRLFERGPTGFKLTQSGHEVIALAEVMEEQADKLDRHFHGRDQRLAGVIRITIPQTLLLYLFGDIFVAFRNEYPDIHLEINVNDEVVSLSRREADIAFRVTSSPQETLIGRRLESFGYAIYASQAYLDQVKDRPSAERHWIGWQADHAAPPWVETVIPGAQCAARANDTLAKVKLAEEGLGYTEMACMIADAHPKLVRVTEPRVYAGYDLWMLTHQDMRSTRRLKLFKDFVYERLAIRRSMIKGEAA